MLEGILAVVLIALFILAGCAEDLMRLRYAWQEVKYLHRLDRAVENALRRAGLEAYANKRRDVREDRLRKKEPPVWNRDRNAVDRSDEADRVLDEYRRANSTRRRGGQRHGGRASSHPAHEE